PHSPFSPYTTLFRSRDAASAHELERIAHSVEVELKSVPGTREVQTIGGPGRVVNVALEPTRLRERGLDVASLRQALAAANLGMRSEEHTSELQSREK